jgi:chemotaxis protein histidine kinase CheA
MAIEKVVEIKVNTNVENASSKLNTLKTNLKDVGTQAQQTTGQISGMSKAQDTINAIGDGVGKLNPAFGAAVKGANGLILKMWEMVANPVGAILAGIVVTAKFLYEAFQSSVAGGKELKTIFAAISAVGAQVKDAMFGLGRALIDVSVAAYKFITLDFKGAAESMKSANKEATESYNQLSDAVDGTTFTIIKNLEKQQQANDKARKNQAVVQSETNKLLVQSREILTDETTSIKEKKKALEEVTKAEKASSAEKVRIAAEDLRIAKAKAAQMGGEAEKKAKQELRDLTIALNEAETENAMTGIKLNKQRKMLNRQEIADQKEKNAIKAENDKAAYDADKLALEEKLKQEGLSFKQRRDLIKADLILNAKDRKKLNDDIDKEEKKSIDDHNKAIADLNKKYDDEKLNRLADTAVKKEQLDYERRLAEINTIATTEAEKNTLVEKLNEEHLTKMSLATKTDAEKKAADEKAIEDKKAAEAAEREKQKNEVIASSKQNLSNIINGLETTGLAKSKAGQAISKALALTQIGIDSAVALSKASTLANAEGAAAQLAFPLVPGIGTIARVLSYTSTALSVASNIVRAKQLLSGGGGGGSASGGGGSSPSPTGGGAAPQFNVVGNSGVNQLADVMNTQQQTPVKTYVVAQDVTSGQSLDRNIIRNASLG